MSVEKAGVIDAIGVEKNSGKVILTISDHLGWEDESGHLSTLQAKLNSYLAFIESGEMLESYPDARGRDVIIDVVGKDLPTPNAERFLEKAGKELARAGLVLRFKVLDAQ